MYQGALLWNLLSLEIQNSSSVKVFRLKHKNYLLNSYWHCSSYLVLTSFPSSFNPVMSLLFFLLFLYRLFVKFKFTT